MIKAQFSYSVQECDATMMNHAQKPVTKIFFLLAFIFSVLSSENAMAQLPDKVYMPNIRTARFHVYGNQQALPIYNLNSNDQMELNFDDMDADVKSYYYSIVLCDYNWVPVDVSEFTYIKGFTQTKAP